MRLPAAQGLYDPRNEHDSCGVGFVADIKGRKSHSHVRDGLQILLNLDHRGAVGADPLTGDGAGILTQIPDAFFREVCDFELPPEGEYGVGMLFLPKDVTARQQIELLLEQTFVAEGMAVIGWRDVPVHSEILGKAVFEVEPFHRQMFVAKPAGWSHDEFERKLYVARKVTVNLVSERGMPGADDYYTPSFSSRTIVYKGMLLAGQVGEYYDDLNDPRYVSAFGLVHQRFSTNTFPSWRLAHPYRMICHNGEINTVRGNTNWMAARKHSMKSDLFGDDLEKVWPLIGPGQSDTACFDNALELLVLGGYSLMHAMMLMIPEAWAGNKLMDPKRRAFYEYHASLMEPWDGPAAVCFTDGRQIGATLDRNGLRPARYIVTTDDRIIMGSEVGVLPVPEDQIKQQWRLQPGKMLLVDMEQGRIVDDAELKASLSEAHPYQQWLDDSQYQLEDLPAPVNEPPTSNIPLLDRQQAFGYTMEDLKFFLEPMASAGDDPIGSMGKDTPISVLSDKPKLLYTYFKQNFAQVTNPPIDPIREEVVMSLTTLIGPRPNLLGSGHDPQHKRLEAHQPILSNEDLEKIREFDELVGAAFRTKTLDICWSAEDGIAGLAPAVQALCEAAEQAVLEEYNILILSDRGMSATRIPMPALLACSAVHHHLIRKGLRTETGLVIETGEAREVHHMCVLAGYGAEAINPYLAFETIADRLEELPDGLTLDKAYYNYVKALNKGLLKVISKMGISTYQSYCGAQIFDAVGLATPFVDKYFTGTATTVEGIGLEEVARETVQRHIRAFGDDPTLLTMLDVGGEYAFRFRGEYHAWNPTTVSHLQHAVRGNNTREYKLFAQKMNDQSRDLYTLRGLFGIRPGTAIPIDEVEPASEIVKRFSTGAMSFGSISREAHSTLAIAMNRIGGRSNTGEGGEEPDRFLPLAKDHPFWRQDGDTMRSRIKQVASGRFGVTTEYLVNADDIQIKMAQGAKPGEGGQLPGHKVDRAIAAVRHSTPGVGLISPPPHHDIYSIEDLAQLIHDLKNANPRARISVKLVSEVGVGTVAAGVSKAKADHVTISGFEGGTGASPVTSLTHAGSPWEIGLAETHQTLVLNGLRGRIAVQTDGGLRTGRDVVIAGLLGADEMGFATAPLISMGCIMMRKCHLNTCPVGVATQNPELRKRFQGTPDNVINYFFFVAEEVRELMAEMGFRTFNDLIGRTDMLDMRKAEDHWKAHGVDLKRLMHRPDVPNDIAVYNCETQDHGLDKALDNTLIAEARPALESRQPVVIETGVRNINRTVGAMLSGEVAKRFGHAGLPEDTIAIKARGVGGQSFGAFLARGVSIEMEGVANDYVGKGLSGGRIAVFPPRVSPYVPEDNIVIGNTVLYGAIDGEAYFRGVAGERFCVRNSGAYCVVEGVGDHGGEYMTGGCMVVLGPTGVNFAAGMSGGLAYVWDPDKRFEDRCNMEMVSLETVDPSEPAPADPATVMVKGVPQLKYHVHRLRRLIERHAHYTDSAVARNILENFDTEVANFVLVMPNDFRRALNEMAEDDAAAGQGAAAEEVAHG
ncbi:MAG: glutamate synthase large subunit [Alphaproteobacteria bacterium]|nr:glutamate synthase large subunit [Alphaproteobacteria bacterium]